MESQTIQRPRRLMAGLFFLAGLRRGRKVMSCLPRYSSPVSLSSWKSVVAKVVGLPLNASDEGSERHRWTKRVCLWVKPERTSLDPMDCGAIRGLILQRICGVRACRVRQSFWVLLLGSCIISTRYYYIRYIPRLFCELFIDHCIWNHMPAYALKLKLSIFGS